MVETVHASCVAREEPTDSSLPNESRDDTSAECRDSSQPSSSSTQPAGVNAPAPVALHELCQSRIRDALREPGLEGTPALDAARTRILAYTKAEPVVFVRRPVSDPNASRAARRYAQMIARSSSPWSMVQRLTTVFASDPSLGRAALLRDGYLYAETPELSFALVDLVKAHHLFDAERIWIQRGAVLLNARKSAGGQYVYEDGPQPGQRVRLLLFDRVGVGEPPPALHRDFRALRQRMGFDRVRIRHLTDHAIVADLHYETSWIPTLLEARGADLDLGCEIIDENLSVAIEAVRALHARRQIVLGPLRRAILAGIDEGLPFDEPLTEYGQQDGQLRRFWLRAYLQGHPSYEINGDRYTTFDPRGRPLVPQVCIDFVLDTLERASGTWWRPKGQTPGRVIGKLDFGTVNDESLRRVSSFVELSQTKTAWFDARQIPEAERVPLKYSARLARYLTQHAEAFIPGDVVLIRGYAPWDRGPGPREMHYHSLFVYETDPITGFPSMLSGNPGRPLLQTWQFEAFRTPDRTIWFRIRPQLAWLEGVTDVKSEDRETRDPPPLSAGPG